MSEVISSKKIVKNGFTLLVELVALYECGFSQFNDKWKRDQDGLIVCDNGDYWNCTWYTIGVLKHGADVTAYQAQKEFDRDCGAFDVCLNVKVLKSDIELIDQTIINSDYSYDDDQTPEQVLEYLQSDYLEIDYLTGKAQTKINQLIK